MTPHRGPAPARTAAPGDAVDGAPSAHVTDGPIIRRLLLELARVLPDDDPGPVTGLSVRQGWGGITSVQVHTTVRPSAEWELGAAIGAAVRRALGVQRHELSFVWDGASAATHPAT